MTKQEYIKYEVEIETNESGKEVSAISYPVFVELREGRNIEFVINRGQVLINKEQSSNAVDQCVDYSSKCIFPIRVLNTNENLAVKNTAEISKRWDSLKNDLQLRFEGEFVDILMRQMDEMMESPDALQAAIFSDIFFQVYFLPMLISIPRVNKNTMQYFTLVNNSPAVKFDTEIEIETAGDTKLISVEGKCADARSFEDIVYSKITPTGNERDEASCEGELELEYKIGAEDGIIESVNGYMFLSDANGEMIRTSIKIECEDNADLTEKDFEPFVKPFKH